MNQNKPASLKNMTDKDAQEYLTKMARNPEKRQPGMESKMFDKVDALTAGQQSVENQVLQHKRALESLTEEHKHIIGEIDGILGLLLEAEDERRAGNGD